MDSITHIVIGACIGEAVAGKRLGKKAMLLGALAQNIPDADIVGSLWMNTSSDLLAHRGFTHSILFAVLISVILGCISRSLQKRTDLTLGSWIFFWAIQVFVHIFLDAFNVYGTGWFEPFSHYRVSFNTIFVADPLFTIWPIIACIVLLLMKSVNPKRRYWSGFAIMMSAIYLICCSFNKIHVDKVVQDNLSNEHIAYKRYFTTPAPLNAFLWYVVVENDSGYYTTYRSVFDKKERIHFDHVYRNDSLLHTLSASKELDQLIRFSQDYYAISRHNDTLIFSDLRFGRMAGWSRHDADFVFFYYLQQPKANDMIIQRGRFNDFNKNAIISLWQRIKGD